MNLIKNLKEKLEKIYTVFDMRDVSVNYTGVMWKREGVCVAKIFSPVSTIIYSLK